MKCSTITYLLSVAVTVFYSDSFHLSTQLKPMTSRSSKLAMKKTDDFSFPFKLLRRACVVGFAVALSGISVNDPFPLSISPPVAFAAAAATPAVGAPAPVFKLPSNLGKDLSLNDFPGKRIVLYFYPGDFTQGCTIEAQGFQRDIAKYNDLGVQIIGVSVDSVDKHLDFGKTYGLDFPLLSDLGGSVSGKYGSLLDFGFIGKFSNRQTYIIAPDTHEIEYVFTDVEGRVAQHSQDVLEKLSALSK